MAVTIVMPQLGESIHEGTIERWLKQPGDTVEEFDPLLEVMTDKVSVEVPAPASGRLASLLVKEGDTVQSGAPIATLDEIGTEPAAPSPSRSDGQEQPADGAKPSMSATSDGHEQPAEVSAETSVSATSDGSGQPASAVELAAPISSKSDGPRRAAGAAESSAPNSSRSDGHGQAADGADEPAPRSVERAAEPQTGEAHRYSPAVRAIAAEHNVDLERVTGTGTGGRVSRRDVLSFLETQGSVAAPPAAPARTGPPTDAAPAPTAPIVTAGPPADTPTPSATGATAAPARPPTAAPASPSGPATESPRPIAAARPPQAPPRPAAPTLEGDERVPLSTMRRLIAEHMSYSKQQVPHAWQAAEVDMSRVVAYRNLHKDAFRKREGISLSYLPFVVKATTVCLRENPAVNASFDGDAIVRHRRINIGVAVGLEEGLVVPVLKEADGLSLAGLARGVADLADRARTRKLKPDDMQGGTFTVNNPGTFGSTLSYSIINAPQAGILTMEAVVDRVVVVDGMIAIRPIMFLCFSFDHRAIDGLQAARFLQGVRKRLEEFDVESTELY